MSTIAPSSFSLDTRAVNLSRDEFASLVAEHQGAVCAVAYSTLGDRAASEEIAQEAFLLAWRKLPELGEPPKLPGWVCGIARNLAKNARRRSGRVEASDTLDEVASSKSGPLDDLLDKESEALVSRALDTLPESYREVLVLFYRQDQSIRQVAEALEITEATAKQRLSRGREKLTETVREMVERTLQRSGPGAAFTAAVVAAIASLPEPAAAQKVSRAAQPAGAGALAAVAGGALAMLVAAGAVWLGSRSEQEVAGGAAVTAANAASAQASAVRAGASAAPKEGGPHFRRRPERAGARAAAPYYHDGVVNMRPQVVGALDRKIDLVLNEAAPREILKLLGEVAETPIVVVGDLPSDVSMDVHAVTVRQALDETLERAGGVWQDVDMVRVVGTPGPAGPRLAGRALDLTLEKADFAVVLSALGESLEMPVWIEAGLEPAPVTIRARKQAAGDLLAKVVADAGLRYEIVPAIEVRPGDDDDE